MHACMPHRASAEAEWALLHTHARRFKGLWGLGTVAKVGRCRGSAALPLLL